MKYLIWLSLFASSIGFTQQANPMWMAGDTYEGVDSFSNLLGDDTILGGYYSSGFGQETLEQQTTGSYNNAFGYQSMRGYVNSEITGSFNNAYGDFSLWSIDAGAQNTALGHAAQYLNHTGTGNSSVGYASLYSVTGNYNLAIGHYAGYYITTGNNNIDIANRGVATDTATIRIGVKSTHKATFIAGISGVPITNGVPVVINSAGQLGVAAPKVLAPTLQGIAAKGYTMTEADVRRIVREELASRK